MICSINALLQPGTNAIMLNNTDFLPTNTTRRTNKSLDKFDKGRVFYTKERPLSIYVPTSPNGYENGLKKEFMTGTPCNNISYQQYTLHKH